VCGPTSQEKELQASSANFSSMLQKNYFSRYASQGNVLDAINRSLSPILAAGPSQRGFAAPQLSALQTAAINAAGANFRNVSQAARTFGAGQGGGGTSGMTSGIQKQIESSIASQAASTLGSQELGITQADYAQGSQNYWRAAGGAQALAAGYSPSSEMSGAIGEGEASYKQASDIASQAPGQQIAGFVTALGGQAVSAFKAYEGAH